MQAISTPIPGLLALQPRVFGDERGFFMESYNRRALQALGITADFVQDNHSRSARGVLRGLHYQIKNPQAKLVRVIAGEIFDVAVDIRRSSSTFGRWFGLRLSAENKTQFFIPQGFAHGFVTLSEYAEVLYKADDFYAPEHERSIIWNDPELNIRWEYDGEPILSDKDRAGRPLREADLFP